MKKRTFQPSFASLTEAELEQLACDLQRDTFAAVLARVRKPRAEGGLDLSQLKSKTPLTRLMAKKNEVDLINALLSARGETRKLTLAEFQSMTAGERTVLKQDPSTLKHTPIAAAVHAAILSATFIRVKEADNTPHQLLALQRLADFPARAEIRENREQLNREQFAHKVDMDTFKKYIATERLELAQKSFNLRQTVVHSRPSLNPNSFTSTEEPNIPHLAPADAGPFTSEQIKNQTSTTSQLPFHRIPGPCPLPDEIVIQNRAFALKLLAGKVDPDTGEELPETESDSSTTPAPGHPNFAADAETIDRCHNAPAEDKAQTERLSERFATPAAQPSQKGSGSGEEFTAGTTNSTELDQNSLPIPPCHPVHNSTQDSAPRTQDLKKASLESNPKPPPDLETTVDRYTIARIREHIRWNDDRFNRPNSCSSPDFVTQNRHCPCGHNAPTPTGGVATTPCPIHESGEFRPFPDSFWRISPLNSAYKAHLGAHNLPYREPTNYRP